MQRPNTKTIKEINLLINSKEKNIKLLEKEKSFVRYMDFLEEEIISNDIIIKEFSKTNSDYNILRLGHDKFIDYNQELLQANVNLTNKNIFLLEHNDTLIQSESNLSKIIEELKYVIQNNDKNIYGDYLIKEKEWQQCFNEMEQHIKDIDLEGIYNRNKIEKLHNLLENSDPKYNRLNN